MSVIPDSGDVSETIIETMNNNEELFEAMLSMPTRLNESMVSARRQELFSPLWEQDVMEKDFAISQIKEREDDFIDIYEDDSEINLPEWLLRIEAQDILIQGLCEKMNVDVDVE